MKTSPQLPPIEETELVLEELFRHTPVGVVLTDMFGTIIDVNDSLCVMTGYPRAEMIGRNLTEFNHPEDDLADVLSLTDDLREGRTGHFVVYRRYISRGGGVVHAKVSVSVVYSKTREPVCGIGFIENITERVTMEEALRRSEVLYRRVVEDQTELIVRCLPDGTRTFVNGAYCRYNNATAEELLATSFFTCMNEDEQRIVRAKFAALSPANPVITDQHWVVGPSGDLRWHEWTDRGFFDEEGRLVEIQSVGRDLTEEHAARQLLVESEERYRRLFNSLPVAVWENDWSGVVREIVARRLTTTASFVAAIAQDPALFGEIGSTIRITAVNPAALAMAGVSEIGEFDRWIASAATPGSALRFAEMVPEVIFGDRKLIVDEYTLTRANGEPIDILIRIARSERWGEDYVMSTIAVDVTERKRIERSLVHKQEVTERAEAAAHIGSWEWIPEHDLIYGSPEYWRIMDGGDGAGPQERPVAECVALMNSMEVEAAEATWRHLRAPSAEPKPAVIDKDYHLLRPDGSVAIARGQSFLSYAPDGSLVRAFGIMRDITESKRAEEEAARHRDELVRADKMISLGILVSGMAHEINNPNHSIGLNVTLVRDAWRDAAALLDELERDDLRVGRMPWSEARSEVAAMLEDIELASERIRNLVTELRGFALDHDPGRQRNVSVNDIVTSALRLTRKHVARATRHFELMPGADVLPVTGNARRLEQVVVNLVLNACQALQNVEQGIRISTGMEGQRVFIRVADEGRGIAPEHLARIRTPFFTTKRAEGGTGLGVPVADRIAGEHGGELTFDSEVGRGTTATLWLPVGRTP